METLWVESEAAEVRAVLPPSSLFSLLASVSMAALHWSASWPTSHRCYYDWEPPRPQRTRTSCYVGRRGKKTLTDTSKTHKHSEQFQKHKWEHFVEHLWIHNSKLPSGCLRLKDQDPFYVSLYPLKSQRGAYRYKRHSSSSSGSCILPLPDNVPNNQFNSRRKRSPIVFPALPTPRFYSKLSYDSCTIRSQSLARQLATFNSTAVTAIRAEGGKSSKVLLRCGWLIHVYLLKCVIC